MPGLSLEAHPDTKPLKSTSMLKWDACAHDVVHTPQLREWLGNRLQLRLIYAAIAKVAEAFTCPPEKAHILGNPQRYHSNSLHST